MRSRERSSRENRRLLCEVHASAGGVPLRSERPANGTAGGPGRRGSRVRPTETPRTQSAPTSDS